MTRLCLVSILLASAAFQTARAQTPITPLPPVADPQRLAALPDAGRNELHGITRRIEAIEAENARLRAEGQQLRQMLNLQLSSTPAAFVNSTNTTAAATCATGGGCDGAVSGCTGAPASCSDSGAPACEGLPKLCGDCLEKLSWNKSGGWRIVPFGRLRLEAIYSTAPQTGDAVVVLLNPNNPGLSEDQATVHAKQSQVNFAVTGPAVGNYETSGVFLINFMGAQPLRNFSGANIVLAYGELKNEYWRIAFGRMLDLFGPIAPNSVNQIAQRGAGDIGIYRGALHFDHYVNVNPAQKWTFSTRISQQDISDYAGVPGIRGKDNGWPNVEARIGLELGPQCDYGRPVEVGLSGVIGETQAVADPIINQGIFFPAIDNIEQTRGAALDFQLNCPCFGIRGEVWWGQAAGTYFVAVLQSLNPQTTEAVESVGGWAELYYRLSPAVTMHLGYGIDDPRNQDLGFINPGTGVGQISLNDVAWWNAIWNVTDYFELAFEVSHRRTRYLVASASNEGTLFHFASTLKY